jgi:hypothetical protein
VNPGTGAVIQRRARPRPEDCTLPAIASESRARCTVRALVPSASAKAELDHDSPSARNAITSACWLRRAAPARSLRARGVAPIQTLAWSLGDSRRLKGRLRQLWVSASSDLRPSSLFMDNTPVEVQFTPAGCLNYPCRTPRQVWECLAKANPAQPLVGSPFPARRSTSEAHPSGLRLRPSGEHGKP